MARFDKVTKEFLGGTESGADSESGHSALFRGNAQDLVADVDVVMSNSNTAGNLSNQTPPAMTNPTLDQVNSTTHVEIGTQDLNLPVDPVLTEAELVIAEQVAADLLYHTTIAKVLKMFRPTDTMHNHLLKM